jgi:hypothetical protein
VRRLAKQMVAPILCAMSLTVVAGSRAPVMGQSAELRLRASLSAQTSAGGIGSAEFQVEAGKPSRFKAEVQGVRLPNQTLHVQVGGSALDLALVGGQGRVEASGVVSAHAGDIVSVSTLGATPTVILSGTLK